MKIDTKNIVEYLKSLDIFRDVNWFGVKVAEVTKHTNVNFVYEVDLKTKQYPKIYLKQAFDFVKVNPKFPAPINRQKFEKLSIDYLQRSWSGRIPKVIHYDCTNNILLLTDVGKGASLLADEIQNGRLHFEIGSDLGLMMAQLHSPTFAKNDYPVRNKKANQEHIEFIFNFRLQGAKEILLNETEELFEESLKAKSSLIYADWASKNVFVAGEKVRLVDFENLVRLDPAFDIGYALAHWVLDLNQQNKTEMIRFFQDFEESYRREWKEKNKKEVNKIFCRASKYVGAMMLHRLVGIKNTNRMEEYLSKEIPLIKIAKSFMKGNYLTPSNALRSQKI